TRIANPAAAAAFAASVRATQRSSHGLTAIGSAMLAAAAAFDHMPEPAAHRVIDVSGDGMANFGVPPIVARDQLVKQGITINGLAILTEEPWLDDYYRHNVIGGPAAFVSVAKTFDSFAEAMLRKLVQEVASGPIEDFERRRPSLDRLAADGEARPLDSVRLRAPLPRPGKILCCIANYWEHAQREARPLNMFLKNPEAVVGPGDTIILPEFTEPWIFMHEAELALVIKGPAKKVGQADWKSAVFGYTCLIDVSARG